MEQWKLSVLTGIILILLATLFTVVKKNLSIWMILVIVLGVANIIIGVYRKTKG